MKKLYRRKTNEIWNNQAVEILTLNLKTSSHFSPSWVILLFCWARYLSQIVLPFTQEYNSGKSFREIWIIICGYIQYNRDTGIQSRGSVWTLSLEYSFPVTEIEVSLKKISHLVLETSLSSKTIWYRKLMQKKNLFF